MVTSPKMQALELEYGRPQPRSEPEPPSGPEYRPRSLQEFDVRQTVLEDLALKTLYVHGSMSVLGLAAKLKLSFEVTTELFNRMRDSMFCQVTGLTGTIPQIAITAQGRSRATDLLQQSSYTGAAPVSLESYVAQTRKQSVQKVEVHAQDVERAFAHLVLDKELLDHFGTALNSGEAIFIYGPSGVGKTTMAEVLSRVLAEDSVWIPHAVEVDGQIITVYDPSLHKHAPESEPQEFDGRWIRCRRPAVLVGGELTIEMLDMQFNPALKYYVAPVQMKANNGVLIIDDFGRQRLRPDELINRWIVPLDRRIDFLTLSGGRKIEIPFEMLVVFASNKDPAELVDPAFYRRIPTKIQIGEVPEAQFCEIFRRVAAEKQVSYDAWIPNDLIDFVKNSINQELRSCYPRDIVNQVCWAARYEGKKPHIDRPALIRAIDAYFLK
ncbi:MAG TPA: hypothetical protein VMV39_07960 [Terracidiphilus sp.]|nr:hypothetical protein [Terracidiphilus sp.]